MKLFCKINNTFLLLQKTARQNTACLRSIKNSEELEFFSKEASIKGEKAEALLYDASNMIETYEIFLENTIRFKEHSIAIIESSQESFHNLQQKIKGSDIDIETVTKLPYPFEQTGEYFHDAFQRVMEGGPNREIDRMEKQIEKWQNQKEEIEEMLKQKSILIDEDNKKLSEE